MKKEFEVVTINSKGKILTSSDEVLFDSEDFKTLANKIDEVNDSLTLDKWFYKNSSGSYVVRGILAKHGDGSEYHIAIPIPEFIHDTSKTITLLKAQRVGMDSDNFANIFTVHNMAAGSSSIQFQTTNGTYANYYIQLEFTVS